MYLKQLDHLTRRVPRIQSYFLSNWTSFSMLKCLLTIRFWVLSFLVTFMLSVYFYKSFKTDLLLLLLYPLLLNKQNVMLSSGFRGTSWKQKVRRNTSSTLDFVYCENQIPADILHTTDTLQVYNWKKKYSKLVCTMINKNPSMAQLHPLNEPK